MEYKLRLEEELKFDRQLSSDKMDQERVEYWHEQKAEDERKHDVLGN